MSGKERAAPRRNGRHVFGVYWQKNSTKYFASGKIRRTFSFFAYKTFATKFMDIVLYLRLKEVFMQHLINCINPEMFH